VLKGDARCPIGSPSRVGRPDRWCVLAAALAVGGLACSGGVEPPRGTVSAFHVEVEAVRDGTASDVWGVRDGTTRRSCATSEVGAAYAELVLANEHWRWAMIPAFFGDEPLWLEPDFEPNLFSTGLRFDDFWVALLGGSVAVAPPRVLLSPPRVEPTWLYPDGRELTMSRWTRAGAYRVPTRAAAYRHRTESELFWEFVASEASDEVLVEWCPQPLVQVMREVLHSIHTCETAESNADNPLCTSSPPR
jgi:hypothetical protein